MFITVMMIRRFAGFSLFSAPITWSRWQLFSSVAFASQTIFFSTAILLISTADTFLISNATPVYLVFWQLIFERKVPSLTEIGIVGLALFGLVLFLLDSLTVVMGTNQLPGFGAALIAGFSFAGHIYAQGKVGKEGLLRGERVAQGSVVLGSLLTCLIAFPLASLLPVTRVNEPPLWSWLCIAGLGIFQFAIPMMLWARVLSSIHPMVAAFMPTLIAVWAPLWTKLILDEPFPGAVAIGGAVLVHFAVLYAAIRRMKPSEQNLRPADKNKI